MSNLAKTPINSRKIAQLLACLERRLAETLTPEFHGKVAVEFTVQGGTIQHISHRVKQRVAK